MVTATGTQWLCNGSAMAAMAPFLLTDVNPVKMAVQWLCVLYSKGIYTVNQLVTDLHT